VNDDTWHELGDFDQIKGWPERVHEHALEEAAAKMRAEATGATPTRTINLPLPSSPPSPQIPPRRPFKF
jgi:hypothetical protein